MLTLTCVGLCVEAYVDPCDRRFSSVSWACWKQTSQLGVCPRFWYMFAEFVIVGILRESVCMCVLVKRKWQWQ